MASPFEVKATSGGGGNGECPPEGNYPGTLVALVDLGTHEEEYNREKYDARKVLFVWELSGEMRSDGTPFVVSQDYTLTEKLGAKSKLRTMLESWRGKKMEEDESLDLERLLGKPCLLNVGKRTSSKGNDYPVLLGVTPVMRGMTVPRATHEPFSWYVGAGPFLPPDWLPYLYGEPVCDKIEACKEVTGAAPIPRRARGKAAPEPAGVGSAAGGYDDDSIPF